MVVTLKWQEKGIFKKWNIYFQIHTSDIIQMLVGAKFFLSALSLQLHFTGNRTLLLTKGLVLVTKAEQIPCSL